VVRHGESEGNIGHRLTAAIPGEPLTERGRAQVGALAQRLRGRKVARVYASPLLRAQQTGQILADAFGAGIATVEGVREFSMGRCDGSEADEDWAHIDATFVRWLDGDLHAGVDGGETGHAVVGRFRESLQGIADEHRGETVVVVSHGGAMCLALPRLTGDVAIDHARAHPVPNCGLAEISVDDHDWALRQWPGDPDRGPHPGDLVDLVGRAGAHWLRRSGTANGATTAEIGGVPCVRLDIDEPWATQAVLTGLPEPPSPEQLDEVLNWLRSASPGSWQVTVRAEHLDDPVLAGLTPALELGVWMVERPSPYRLPDGVEVGEARDAEEFLGVYGHELAPLIDGQLGRPGMSFLVLREHGQAVGCARVTEVGGTAYVSAIGVLAQHRGRGLGRLVSAAATNQAVRRAGLAWLHCDDHLALYEGLGYRRLTTHVHLSEAAVPPAAMPHDALRPPQR
jgi:probable phosphoglycerate mutase